MVHVPWQHSGSRVFSHRSRRCSTDQFAPAKTPDHHGAMLQLGVASTSPHFVPGLRAMLLGGDAESALVAGLARGLREIRDL
jgi:hypothetical protein